MSEERKKWTGGRVGLPAWCGDWVLGGAALALEGEEGTRQNTGQSNNTKGFYSCCMNFYYWSHVPLQGPELVLVHPWYYEPGWSVRALLGLDWLGRSGREEIFV